MRKSPRYRYYAGLVIFILGLFAVVSSLASGVIGIMIYCNMGNLIYVGNPKVGPGVIIALMVEGFVLDLFPSIGVTLLGYFVKATNVRAVENSKKARTKLKDKKDVETFIRLLKSWREGRVKKTTDLENEQDFSKIILSEEDDPKIVRKYRCSIERYVKGSPKVFTKILRRMLVFSFLLLQAELEMYLFLSIFLMVATNLGMAFTCVLMSKGLGTVGIMDVTKRYLTEKKARTALDWVQQKGECCGEQVFTEWFGIKWCMETKERPPTEYNLENFNICPPERRTVKFDVPSSCCSPPRSPCIHDALDILGLGPLNMEGCRKYMNQELNPLYKSLAWYHAALSLLKLILLILVFTVRPSSEPKKEASTDEERSRLIQQEEPPKTRPHASTSLTSVSRPTSHSSAHATSSLGRIPSSFQEFNDTEILSSTRHLSQSSSASGVYRKFDGSINSDAALSPEVTERGAKRFSADSIELEKQPAQIEPSLQRTHSSSLGNVRSE